MLIGTLDVLKQLNTLASKNMIVLKVAVSSKNHAEFPNTTYHDSNNNILAHELRRDLSAYTSAGRASLALMCQVL